jgi:hypothetical protein
MLDGSMLDLPFKGSRDYLHSTDILPALNELAHARCGAQAHVDSLTLRRPFTHAIRTSFESSAGASGSFRIRRGDECISGWLHETESPVTGRVSFDTSRLLAATISGQGFAKILEPQPGYSALEVVVTLMKAVSAQVNRRPWWVCQLNFDHPLTEVFPVEARIQHNLIGRFLVYEIVQAGMVIGSARGISESNNSLEASYAPVN